MRLRALPTSTTLVIGLVLACTTVVAPAGPALGAPAVPSPCAAPSFTDQVTETPWPLRRLHPSQAWPLSRGRDITVAVIDSGVSADHPKLAGQVLPGVDYTPAPRVNGQCDEVGHGTFVAGIIAGRDSPDAPFTGVAPDARILPLRITRNEQSNDPNEPAVIATAIRTAVAQGARVINLSLVVSNPPPAYLRDVVASYESVAHSLDQAVKATQDIIKNYRDVEHNNTVNAADVDKSFAAGGSPSASTAASGAFTTSASTGQQTGSTQGGY